jgi:uncharacterized protein (TIGR00369 family)
MGDFEQEIVATMQSLLAESTNPAPALPPPAFKRMQGRIVDYVEGELMICAFPALAEYANPAGLVQGGFIGAAIDNTFGPLSLLVTRRPCSTLNLNTTFVRPITAGDGDMTVEARVRALTRALVFLEAKVADQDGRTAVTATSTMLVRAD